MSAKIRLLRSLITEINQALKAESSEEAIRNLSIPKKAELISGIAQAKAAAGTKPITYVRDVGDKYIYAAIGGTQDLTNFEPEYYICIYDNMRFDKNTFGKKFLPGDDGYKPKSIKDFYSVNPSEISKLSKPVKAAVLASAAGLKQAYGSMNTYQYITQQVREKVLPAGDNISQTPPPLETSPNPPAAGATDPAAAATIAKDAVVDPDSTGGGTSTGGPGPGDSGSAGVAALPGSQPGTGDASSDPSGESPDDDDEGGEASDSTRLKVRVPGDHPNKPRRKWIIPFIPSLELNYGWAWSWGRGKGKGPSDRGPSAGGKRGRGDGDGSPDSSGSKGRDISPDDAGRILGKEMDPFVREYLKLSPAEKDLLDLLRETYTTQTPNPSKTLEILRKIPSYGSSEGNIYGAFVANRPKKDDKEAKKSALKQFKKIGIYNGEEIMNQARSVYVAGATLDRSGARGRFSPDRPSMLETLGTIIACYGYFDSDKIFDKNFENHRSPLVKEIARIYGFPEYEIESVMAAVM